MVVFVIFCMYLKDELLACECLMLDTTLLQCKWAITSGRFAGKLRLIKLVLIFYSDGVHLRYASAYCELRLLIYDMFHKDGLLRDILYSNVNVDP